MIEGKLKDEIVKEEKIIQESLKEEKELEVKKEKLKEENETEDKSKEEKEIEEEIIKKSVSERKKEIEKRLSQDIDDKKKISLKETKPIMRTKEKKPSEDLPEKETAEEKAISPEPAHLSFDEKRKSFELGITPKGILQTQADVNQKFLAEEKKQEDVIQMTTATEQEESLSFQEKRRSFEKGLSMKKPGDKLPASDRLKVNN